MSDEIEDGGGATPVEGATEEPSGAEGDESPDETGVDATSDEGTVGSHPPVEVRPFRVAPTPAKDFNVLSLDVPTVACMSMNDLLFAFDSSFVTTGATKILKDLPGLRDKHKNANGELPPLSIFGHADPVGNDDYNKALSGRRARAVYGLLIQEVSIWDDLFSHPSGGDDWPGKGATKMMSAATGLPVSTSRKALMSAYMKQVCPFQLQKTDFLGRGAVASGKADFQGCSEFNPLVILSKSENSTLSPDERDRQNESNRRVVMFLFRAGRRINPQAWPCPAASEGVAGCKLRFFLDGEKRRTAAADQRRTFAKTRDTFACRFYDRMARVSPCEAPVPPGLFGVKPLIFVQASALADTAALAPAASGDGNAAVKEPSAKPAPAPVTPAVGPAKGVVVVPKPHTKPARVPIVLKTDTPFSGTGEFAAAPVGIIDFFLTATGGKPIAFDKKQNVFQGGALTKGVTVFAQGAKASGSMNDVNLTLTLTGGGKKINNNPGAAKMTSVDVSLQICKLRTAAGADPPTLSETEKIDPGRAIHVQTKDNMRARAMLIVSAKPAAFTGKLLLSVDDKNTGKVKLFPNEKQTPGEVATVTPAEMPATVTKLFVEGSTISGKVKDLSITLGIKDGEKDADHVGITVIEVKLDIFKSREKAGKDPVALSDDDKVKLGRAIHLQDAAKTKHRAMMVVRQVKPAGFVGKLVLAPLDATKVKVFPNEKPTAGEAGTLEMEHNAKFPAAGLKQFAEGLKVSTGLADTACKLGVKDVEDECDRVSITVFQVEKVEVKLRGTPCKRDGSRANIMPSKVIATDSETFDAKAMAIVRECGDLEMEATVKPAAITLEWDAVRASDDNAGLKGAPPTSVANGSDKKRKVTADATGSFHVSAFVDSNGNKKRNGDEDGVTVNVSMVELEVVAGASNNQIRSAPTYSNTAGSLNVSSGPGLAAGVGTQTAWNDAGFAGHAIAMKVNIKLTGGGPKMQRGTDQVTLGYIQNTPDDTFQGTYADGKTEKEKIFVVPVPGRIVLPPPPPTPPPAPPPPAPPAVLAFPVRDHAGIANFNGIHTFINSSSDNNPPDRKDLAAGGRTRVVRFVDSPAAACDLVHPVSHSALASISGSNFFKVFLVAFSSDYDENFTVVASATWSTTYGSFTAAGGWSIAGAAVTKSGTAMTVNKPPVKGESTFALGTLALERCPPAYTDNFAMDAR